MKLPGKINRLFKQKKDEKERCLAILFEQTRILVAVFTSLEDKVDILAYKSAPYSGALPESIDTIDHLLTSLTQEINEVEEVEDAIFGFPQEYVEKDKIKPEIGHQLKNIVKQLSIKPKGYVVISEALAFYLSSKSGSQESAIFAGIHKNKLHISLVKIGKIIEEKTVPRTEKISFDIETALNSFNQEVLPAKIVLYNGTDDLSIVKEELLTYPWEDKANFLHFPKIEILPALTTLQAVVGAFTQKGKVILKEEKAIEEPVASKDVDQSVQTAQPVPEKDTSRQRVRIKINNIMPRLKKYKKIYVVMLLLILAAVGGIFWFTNFYSSSIQIKILVDTQSFESDLDFTLDPGATSVDTETKTIPGEEVSVKLDGEKSKKTEGTELVGDSAKGKVTIYNKTTKQIEFDKGDTLITSGKIKFALDEEVKVASASEKVDGLTFGKKQTGITATSIGPDGNIKSGAKLVFEDLSEDDYSAQTDEDFSGGKSREVSVVSKDDLGSLRKRIVKDLSKKAKAEIENIAKGELTVIEDTLVEEISKETPSKKVGSQAKEVTLKATVAFTALAYNPDDIVTLLRSDAKTSFPDGYIMREGVGRQKVVSREINKDGSVSFKSSFATTLLPEIEEEDIKSEAVGKKVDDFEKYLRGLNNIGGFELIFENNLPFLSPSSLPSDPSKINVTISTR